jgi:hypothetical protein
LRLLLDENFPLALERRLRANWFTAEHLITLGQRGHGLEPGVEFVVIGEGDAIVLKAIRPPSMREFDRVMARARQAARPSGETCRDEAIRHRGGDRGLA